MNLTLQELNSTQRRRRTMTPEAQRITIAKACGWHICAPHVGPDIPEHLIAWERIGAVVMAPSLPNYLTDLNAMHEAESELSHTQYLYFTQRLDEICLRDADQNEPSIESYSAYATAAKRAEAFLRTLNLWDDAK